MPTPRRLSVPQIRRRLTDLNAGAQEAPWRIASGRLRKRFVFDDFGSAFAFMSKVARAAESMDHHPNWSNAYARVDVALTTHSAGGLTPLDFELAARIESIRRRQAGSSKGRGRGRSGRGSRTRRP